MSDTVYKISKLEWIFHGLGVYQSNQVVDVIYRIEYNETSHLWEATEYCATEYIGEFETLSEAQQACQSHFEKFMLEGLEEVIT